MAIRVLTVDDSPIVQRILAALIAEAPGLVHAGAAGNGREAVDLAVSLQPDVITLDVEMPVMDGLAALERIMEVRPTPVIMLSSQTRASSMTTIRALQRGALDFIAKPEGDLAANLKALRGELIEKITVLGRFRSRQDASGSRTRGKTRDAEQALPAAPRTYPLIAIGSSTGGTAVLSSILESLCPPMGGTILAIQHMPALFTASFAQRLAETSRLTVREAMDGDRLLAGHVFVAPGGKHLSVRGNRIHLGDGDPVNGHRPSIDIAFESVARRFGPDACGILLTGLGRDGARGMAAIKEAGGHTVAQDERTSVVFGMPKAAILTGKVDLVLPDSLIRLHVTRIVPR